MKILIVKALALTMFIAATSSATIAQTAKEMELQDFKYISTIGSTKWQISFKDKTKYDSAGIPLDSFLGEASIEGKKSSGEPLLQRVSVANYPYEDGFFILSLQGMDYPLFLLISNGGGLPDLQRRIHLLSPSCNKPLAHFDATMEEATQLSVVAGANNFKVSYEDIEGKKAEKSWTRPEGNKSLCSHGFR